MPNIKPITKMSTSEILENFGVKSEEGKIIQKEGKFYINVGAKEVEMNLNKVTVSGNILDIIGKPVNVIYDSKDRILFVNSFYKYPRIICYVPVPDEFLKYKNEIESTMRKKMINKMVDEKIISKKFGKALLKSDPMPA